MDSVVGIATSYGLDDKGLGVRVHVGFTNLLSSTASRPPLGPPSLLYNGYRGLFAGGKATGT
jgi:hypothetical protein